MGAGPKSGAPVGSWPAGAGERGPVPKLMWRVKLVVELEPGVMTETGLARIECDEEGSLAEPGLRLEVVKRLTAAPPRYGL